VYTDERDRKWYDENKMEARSKDGCSMTTSTSQSLTDSAEKERDVTS
jgi:hypothetical protein